MDIKTTCLGVLMLGEASGYEIRKAFEEGPFSHFADGGFGSIYPALTRLTEEGLAQCVESAPDDRPTKKVYRITDKGWDHLEAAMRAKVPGEDKYKSDLLFILFFADWQEPSWIARVIDTRIDFYRYKVTQMEEALLSHPEMRGRHLVHGFGLTVYRASLDYLLAHRQDFIDAAQNRQQHVPTTASAAR
ncbi:MAG: PadR family transcriptional regulator [Pseudomonadota bacterium]